MKNTRPFRNLAIVAFALSLANSSWATITVIAQHDEAHAKGFTGNGQGSTSFDHPFTADILDTNVHVGYSDSCFWQGNTAQSTSTLDVRRRMFNDRGMRITGSITASCSSFGFESVSASGDAKHQLAFHVDRATPYTALVTLKNNTAVNGVFNLIGANGFVIGTGAPLGAYTFSGTLVPGDYYIDYYVSAFMSPGQASGAMDVVLEVGRVPNTLTQ